MTVSHRARDDKIRTGKRSKNERPRPGEQQGSAGCRTNIRAFTHFLIFQRTLSKKCLDSRFLVDCIHAWVGRQRGSSGGAAGVRESVRAVSWRAPLVIFPIRRTFSKQSRRTANAADASTSKVRKLQRLFPGVASSAWGGDVSDQSRAVVMSPEFFLCRFILLPAISSSRAFPRL